MKHEAKGQLFQVIMRTGAFTKSARFHIPLTVARTQKDILSATARQHTLGYFVVLAFNPVLLQFRPMLVPYKTGLYLIGNISQIGIDGKIIAACGGPYWFYALGLRAKGMQNAYLVNHPN